MTGLATQGMTFTGLLQPLSGALRRYGRFFGFCGCLLFLICWAEDIHYGGADAGRERWSTELLGGFVPLDPLFLVLVILLGVVAITVLLEATGRRSHTLNSAVDHVFERLTEVCSVILSVIVGVGVPSSVATWMEAGVGQFLLTVLILVAFSALVLIVYLVAAAVACRLAPFNRVSGSSFLLVLALGAFVGQLLFGR